MVSGEGLISLERIATQIYVIRGEQVLLDADLAELYGVETRVLNQAVTRNRERFPEDFMFQLTWEESETLRSQNVILDEGQGEKGRGEHRKYRPYAFTEQGVAMLSGVLRSKQAIRVNVAIMRTFVRLRRVFTSHEELARKVTQHDREIGLLFQHVQDLLALPEPVKKRFGF